MGFSFIISTALVMGLMLSPESLTLFGNNIGLAGIPFLVIILLAATIQIFTALSYGELFALFPGQGSETRFIKEALGPFPAIVFPLCSRVVCTICLSTVILVTSGFVFNEVFLYWFPNFAFAFLLLGFLLIINLLGQRVAEKLQVIFVTVAIFSLLFLSVSGLMGSGNAAPSIAQNVSHGLNIRIVFIGLVLFIGFDLVGFVNEDQTKNPVHLVKSMIVGIIIAGAVLSLWGLVSVLYVPLNKLAETTIPHTITARKILGQSGRIIIGFMVLAGTCSAVNALFIAVSRMIAHMSQQGLLPRSLGLIRKKPVIPAILIAAGIAIMMATGMAGEPELEIYLRAGLLFWLLNYTLVHLCVLILKKRLPYRSQPWQIPGSSLLPVIGLLVTFIGFIGLLATDSESIHLLTFMVAVFIMITFFSLIWISIHRKKYGPYKDGLKQ